MAPDPTRVLRGALAGAAAAGVWAAQQPFDKRVFGVDYDDVELLGSIVTGARGTRETYVLGAAMHLANGALFGAVYAALSPSIGGPGPARGLLAGMGENLATWPATALVPAVHPIGTQFPKLWGDNRAFAQACWRHALFGTILGVLEERLNPPQREAAHAEEDHSSSNGHGNIANVVVSPA
ncbi:MAG: hypothetical protein QOF76_4460 [Solirubrobacteraceae bacterium]|jgi:hypothetical protein|nr:hypothetical protein [Solirubrobacteraceae bacterium]